MQKSTRHPKCIVIALTDSWWNKFLVRLHISSIQAFIKIEIRANNSVNLVVSVYTSEIQIVKVCGHRHWWFLTGWFFHPLTGFLAFLDSFISLSKRGNQLQYDSWLWLHPLTIPLDILYRRKDECKEFLKRNATLESICQSKVVKLLINFEINPRFEYRYRANKLDENASVDGCVDPFDHPRKPEAFLFFLKAHFTLRAPRTRRSRFIITVSVAGCWSRVFLLGAPR